MVPERTLKAFPVIIVFIGPSVRPNRFDGYFPRPLDVPVRIRTVTERAATAEPDYVAAVDR